MNATPAEYIRRLLIGAGDLLLRHGLGTAGANFADITDGDLANGRLVEGLLEVLTRIDRCGRAVIGTADGVALVNLAGNAGMALAGRTPRS